VHHPSFAELLNGEFETAEDLLSVIEPKIRELEGKLEICEQELRR
jgi:hypothetical protein